MTFVNIKIIPYPLNGCQLLVIGCPEAFSFKKLSDFTPFFDEAGRLETDPTAARMKTGPKHRKLNSPLNVSGYLQQNLQSVIQRLARFLTLPAKKEESNGS